MAKSIDAVVVPKYPHIEVSYSSTGGNIQVCLALFVEALKEGGVNKLDIDKIVRHATASDKEHLFQIIAETVTIKE